MACGRYDVDQMLDELTPEQFDEWVAWFILEAETAAGEPDKPAAATEADVKARYGNYRRNTGNKVDSKH